MCSEEKQENIRLPWQPHHRDLREVSPVALAFVGDGVYEVLVRQRLVTRTRLAPGRLHGLAVKFVSAAGQSRALEAILPLLTEEEAAVVQRGKNSSKASVTKHATPRQYRASTAFESLLGWLQLQGKQERILELFEVVWETFAPEFLGDKN